MIENSQNCKVPSMSCHHMNTDNAKLLHNSLLCYSHVMNIYNVQRGPIYIGLRDSVIYI